jgi:hypothetical protein
VLPLLCLTPVGESGSVRGCSLSYPSSTPGAPRGSEGRAAAPKALEFPRVSRRSRRWRAPARSSVTSSPWKTAGRRLDGSSAADGRPDGGGGRDRRGGGLGGDRGLRRGSEGLIRALPPTRPTAAGRPRRRSWRGRPTRADPRRLPPDDAAASRVNSSALQVDTLSRQLAQTE